MKLYWQVFVVVAVATIKENLCVPAIRPLSQRGIIFPEENWDDCFIDDDSQQPGICISLEECPEVLNKWNKQNIVPKTCYFIKKEQFVCCPMGNTKEFATINIKTTNADYFVNTKKPNNNVLHIFNVETNTLTENPNTIITGRPSNIYLHNITTSSEKTLKNTSTKRPSNIYVNTIKTSTEKTLNEISTSNIYLHNITTSSEKTLKNTSTKRPSNIHHNTLKTSTEETLHDISSERPSNIYVNTFKTSTEKNLNDISSERPSNIYVNTLKTSTEKNLNDISSERPSNIYVNTLKTSTEKNLNDISSERPSNIYVNTLKTSTEKNLNDISSERTSNIYVNTFKTSTEKTSKNTSTKRPSNIYHNNLKTSTEKTFNDISSERPSNIYVNTLKTSTVKTVNDISSERPSNIYVNTLKISTEKTLNDISSKRPSNTYLPTITTSSEKTLHDISSERPTNIYVNTLKTSTEKTLNDISSKRPSNIFLDKVFNNSDKDKFNINEMNTKISESNNFASTKNPVIFIPDIFSTDSATYNKKRCEIECDLHNSYTIDINGSSSIANEFPFMAALGWKLNDIQKIWYACGGVLISPIFVLTAAHCAEIEGEEPSYVHLGGKNLTEPKAETIKIKQIIKYPGYNNTTIFNDIALVELEKEVNNSVACLWSEHDLPFTHLTSLGYGHRPFGGLGPNQLRKSSFTIIDKKECELFYEFADKVKKVEILDTHLCAGDLENLETSCHGDSGGPLIMEFDKISYVVGITSFDLGCRNLPPSIYTRVSSFVNWIEEIVWPEIDVRLD